ncbi:diacylglycerol kinase family protein [Virgibacillus kekensis]|uniref:Diacylglycerol kinase family protein n=1 Tax=Virgibacillus kekensis TaxID=202261 RepID=A0ABV9DKK7_9BACI
MNLELNDDGKKRSIGFSFAWNGLKEVTRTERNFRIHVIVAVLVVAAGLLSQLNRLEWAIIILTIGLVLVAEITNTAVEKMMDYVKPDIHPLAKTIKDIAAGAVLLAAIIAVIVGLTIFGPIAYNLLN